MNKVFVIFMVLLMSTISVASAETASVSSGKVFFRCTEGYISSDFVDLTVEVDVYAYEEFLIKEINIPVLKVFDPATNSLVDTVSNVKIRTIPVSKHDREITRTKYGFAHPMMSLAVEDLANKAKMYPKDFNVVVEGDVTMDYEEIHVTVLEPIEEYDTEHGGKTYVVELPE